MNETTRKLQEMLAQREDSEIIAGETGTPRTYADYGAGNADRAVRPGSYDRSGEVEAAYRAAGIQTGRGPTGRLRNFRAMGDEKFYREAASIRSENNDPEAIEAVNEEQARRES